MKQIVHNKNNNKWFSGRVLRFITQYSIIQQDEPVCVGLSGGVDSMTLLFVLEYIRRFSALKFDLSAIHVQVYAKNDPTILQDYCEALGVKFYDISIKKTDLPVSDKGICYTCSKLKKGAMIEFLKEKGINKVAFGHHADDLAETFLMNIDYHHIVETLKPVTYLDKNDFTVVRPLLCMTKKEIIRVHKYFELPKADYICDFEEKNRREVFREILSDIDDKLPGFSSRVAESFLKFD